ncbi:MAG TPA: hypothetical protein VFX43_07220 [Chitinophagaceae bacterium]|nr:hypothetical protein [Chitinophagaceae bacterium]
MRLNLATILLRAITLVLASALFTACSPNKSARPVRLHWDTLALLPPLDHQPNPGVAGAFSGVSNGQLMVAGGANFPGKPAWQSGAKKYWNTVYVLPFDHGTPGRWMDRLFHFPYPVAYGASLTTSQGIVCIGGKNDSGYLSRVSLLRWNDRLKDIEVKPLADLPMPLASMAAARIGDTVYIAGGENKQGKQDGFYRLNLQDPSAHWERLPALPAGALSDAVLASQLYREHLCLYLIGGRTAEHDGVTTFYNTVYRFDPVKGGWSPCHGITGTEGKPVTLAAGTGIAVGDHYILLIGGDDGRLFNQLATLKRKSVSGDDSTQKKYWHARYDSLFIHHPGFDRNIYLYNTQTDAWKRLDNLPFPTPATTNIFRYDDRIMIPSGEIRPGVRTAAIFSAKILKE